MPRDPLREALAAWVCVLAGLAALALIGRAVPILGQLTSAAAVAAFLVVPTRLLERRGQEPGDAGLRFDRWGRDAAWAVAVCAVVLPPFAFAFVHFVELLPRLPPGLRGLLAPYGAGHTLRFAAPTTLSGAGELAGRIAGNAAVALSEEYFYRGYLTLRLEEALPPRLSILGAKVGGGAVLAAALFAVGHLLVPAPWRLAVFFPALMFAWLRARTGTVVAAAICHFLFNVSLLALESAVF
jgi:membrane protease YdiL (CAAX protease family)